MMRLGAVLAAFIGLAGQAHAALPFDVRYGVICESRETGDLDGIQLRLIGSVAEPRVEFMLCEGGCSAASIYRAPVHLDGDGFRFDYVEKLWTHNGDKIVESHDETTTVEGRFTSRGLALTSHGALQLGPATLQPEARSKCPRGHFRSAPFPIQ